MRLNEISNKLSVLALAGLLPLSVTACGDDVTGLGETDEGSSSSTGDDSDPTMPATSLTTTTDTTTTVADDSSSGDPDTDTATTDADTGSSTTRGDDDSSSTSDGESSSSTGMLAECGDGVLEGREACDGDDLGDAACPIFGDVACNDDCTLDLTACTDMLTVCNMPAAAIDSSTTELAPAVDTLTVPESFFVTDVNVTVDVSHTWISDVHVDLVSPDDAVGSMLIDGQCGLADDIDARFDDDGLALECAAAAPAVAGDVIPVTELRDLIGIGSMGDWAISVWDDSGFADDGTLNEWCVELTLSQDDPVMCGDDTAHYGETCDGADLNGADCVSIDMGFVGGTLGCADDCGSYDTTGCVAAGCGNDVLEPDTESCDGTDLDGLTCGDFPGLTGDGLACLGDCTDFDTSGCEATCGNDAIDDPTELCDGTDISGETCETVGNFGGGTLGCAADCGTYDTSMCTPAVCGDETAEGIEEECDGADLLGQDCTTLGGDGGTLSCAADCTLDTSECTNLPACMDSDTSADLDGTEDTFQRAFGSAASCTPSAIGSSVFHDVYTFTASEGESVEVSTCDQASFNTLIHVYQAADGSANPFDPSSACTNIVGLNDDGAGCGADTSLIEVNDLVEGDFQVVVTSYDNGETGDYTLSLSCL